MTITNMQKDKGETVQWTAEPLNGFECPWV